MGRLTGSNFILSLALHSPPGTMENQTSDSRQPIVISGPCGAETENQLHETARQLKLTGKVHMLRAGIWKPRTRPGSFEGMGEIGLGWLVKASKETGLPAMTEVATPEHVELVLKAGLKNVWIGARSTVNPFLIQEIAEALKDNEDITVFVKNPVNPDVDLWMGAIERFHRVGIKTVHAIHRGFSVYKPVKYRNEPMWEIPLKLKRLMPEIKLFCDPSHICGRRDMLLDVAQKALDLIYDGLMIETHIEPDKALSDARQQITPAELDTLLKSLAVRSASIKDAALIESLSELRGKIDQIDQELMALIGERMQVAEAIGKIKKEKHITILQPERWNQIKKYYGDGAGQNSLTEEFIEKYLEALHQESIRRQTRVMK